MTTATHTVHDAAKACLRAGLSVLPANREAKRPALNGWKAYQQQLPSPAELDSWFNASASALCIVCGDVSGNLEMIDFDLGGEAFEPWRDAVESQSPGLFERLVVESSPSGGRHVVYRCEQPVSGNAKLAMKRFDADNAEPIAIGDKDFTPRKDADGHWHVAVTTIETRGEGGLFLCAPTGGYELVQGDLANPPTIMAEERDVLLRCARALDEMPKVYVDGPVAGSDVMLKSLGDRIASRPGEDFNARGDVRPLLTNHGWRRVKEGDNEHWCRPGKTAGTSATLKDGVFFNFSSNAPPFEAHTGYSPFAVYTLLEHHGDFAAAASALSLEGYGEQDQQTYGVDLSEFMVGEEEDSRPTKEPSSLEFEIIGASSLVSDHPRLRTPVIHGLLREGETMNVIAAPKTGKSWLALDLAVAVAMGRPWLGIYDTVPGNVLIIDNELHAETSAHRLPKVVAARGMNVAAIGDRIGVANLRGRLEDINGLAATLLALKPRGYKVIILDAFYRFMPIGGDENSNATMAAIYNTIDAVADALGCCFVLIHHSSKGSQANKSVTDVGAGAGSQSRATDTHLVLRPHEEDGVVVLDAAVRSWPPVEPACLRWSFPVWDLDASLDPDDLDGGGRVEPKKKWTPEAFVEAFVGDESEARAVIIDRAVEGGVSAHAAGDLLRGAHSNGLVARYGDGRMGSPYTYQLSPDVFKTDFQR